MKAIGVLGAVCAMFLVGGTCRCTAQVSGNVGYGQAGGRARAEQNERGKRALSREELPPSRTSVFVEANVLMNTKADEYVAVFGISQEGSTPAECREKMDAVVKAFTDEVKQLGIRTEDLFVDFIVQNKVYGYDVTADIAKEKLTGFELKKNLSVRYQDYAMLDKLMVAASHSQIYDLVKVDYVVKEPSPIQNRLAEEAAKIVKQKADRYERLLGTRLRSPAQVYNEKADTYFPTGMYDNYTAAESEDVNAGYYRQKYIVQGVRKSRTFYFNALTADGFDRVINPVVIEPVVQFTYYLKVRYEIEAVPKPARAGTGKSTRKAAKG